jgi:hypothetical protein
MNRKGFSHSAEAVVSFLEIALMKAVSSLAGVACSNILDNDVLG